MNKAILHCSVGILSRREHSYEELMQKLKFRQHSEDEITPVLEFLIKKNYLSDQRFAESLFGSRLNKGYGWLYISNELEQKGVCDTIIAELSKNQQIDWYLQAELAYNKRFGESTIKDQKDKLKRIRFMQSRGFSSDEIMILIKYTHSD
ncbi:MULTISPECIES: regulatory protein RecX [unclassified Colwellia]|uniref:regulatory protein RecX n=1 Tax=unclassified Colwellia TaxID=196834 RepID=UPI0015F40DBD|nr:MULTISPECIES: regulatory protein RecX [unclassified Colwellia]MBA6356867.1 regulatory protein RecX [Colwellia sp. BRX8-3]MBA6359391.1 regulatory protein RecX [Colwellia sp. BRX8-6]MBA6368003.1 regulatory protein RecX [Colwellia sp. BRX8-5]MBA6376578.1 regulatory protein RecX [Colwellia sp. BRX8-2]